MSCHALIKTQGPTVFLSDFDIYLQISGHARTTLLPRIHFSSLGIIHLLIVSCSLLEMSETGKQRGRTIENPARVGYKCFSGEL